jgi:hypothetical protein
VTWHYLPSWGASVMQITARAIRCSNGSNHSTGEYWRCKSYGPQTVEADNSVVQFSSSFGSQKHTR